MVLYFYPEGTGDTLLRDKGALIIAPTFLDTELFITELLPCVSQRAALYLYRAILKSPVGTFQLTSKQSRLSRH